MKKRFTAYCRPPPPAIPTATCASHYKYYSACVERDAWVVLFYAKCNMDNFSTQTAPIHRAIPTVSFNSSLSPFATVPPQDLTSTPCALRVSFKQDEIQAVWTSSGTPVSIKLTPVVHHLLYRASPDPGPLFRENVCLRAACIVGGVNLD